MVFSSGGEDYSPKWLDSPRVITAHWGVCGWTHFPHGSDMTENTLLPSVTQLLSLMSSFDLQFSNESFISCSGHLFDLIFTGDLCSFPLSLTYQSKFLWSVVVGAHLCRLSLPVMTLTSLLSDLPNTWCLLHFFLTCFPSLRSFHFLLLFNLHWYVSWNTASTPSPLFLSSSSSFASSPCCFLAMVFHFQFSRDCKCSPFWQRLWATFLSISLV